ncbi:hypothetical protein AS180_13035 [Priestia veravalensis]|uniref:Uncharacterized protein n=1 Tax=Priestia veravalensis TaxID=1414648 RepID=A0A0V8JKF6_9BACI|nr:MULTISPECIES: hypothetical protein [Priestia]KSU87471.1 hypothetical protein AS180_13035 [Priestia veravalensis]
MKIKTSIHRLKSAGIPPGFFFSQADEDELHQALGVTLKKIDLQKAFKECITISKSEWVGEVDRAQLCLSSQRMEW